jgi:hypothetical protein
MTQPTSKRFVMGDRLDAELVTVNNTISSLDAVVTINTDNISGVKAGAARATVTNYSVANVSALDAIADAAIGDLAFMTTPGTGIKPVKWEAFAGSGSATDWHIVDTIRADTLANLDAFIAATIAIANLTFVIGGLSHVSSTQTAYKFTATSGTKTPLGGLVQVVPTSITALGGSATVTVSGLVTMALVTTAGVVINGCFTSTFDNYLVLIDVNGASTSNLINLQLRGGGTAAAATHDIQGSYAWGTTIASVGALAGASWPVSGTLTATGTTHSAEVKLFGPYLAVPTRGIVQSVATPTTMSTAVTGGSIHNKALLHRTSTFYDGFAILPSAGTINGTIRIYGYNNNNGGI